MHLRPKGIGDLAPLDEAAPHDNKPSNALTAERHWRHHESFIHSVVLLVQPSNALTAERHWRRGLGLV